MPRNPKGELTLGEIRNLARQHNKVSTIKGINSKSRKDLISEIEKMGYRVNHEKKKITLKPHLVNPRLMKVGKSGEQKPQKRTIKKRKKEALKKGGAAPVYVKDRGEEEI